MRGPSRLAFVVPQIGGIVRRWFVFERRGCRDERAAKICPRNCVPAIWKMLAALKCRLCWRARSKHYSRSPKRKGPPERPMVPKAQRLFVSNCLALRRQLTARRLADCCRVDARFTLAFWTLAPWTLAFGHRSRRTLVAIGTGRFRRSSLSARDGARNPLDQPPIIQQSIRRIVQTTIRSSSMKFRSPRLPKQFEGSNLTRPPSRFFFKIDRRREFRPRGPSFGGKPGPYHGRDVAGCSGRQQMRTAKRRSYLAGILSQCDHAIRTDRPI